MIFGYVIYDLYTNGKEITSNPWAVPSYFTSTTEFNTLQHNTAQVTGSLEWALESPTPFHAYNTLPTLAITNNSLSAPYPVRGGAWRS